jgi:hypothetical protein
VFPPELSSAGLTLIVLGFLLKNKLGRMLKALSSTNLALFQITKTEIQFFVPCRAAASTTAYLLVAGRAAVE